MCHTLTAPVSSTCEPRCTVFATFSNAAANSRSTGAAYIGFAPSITSHSTLPAFMSATSAFKSATCSLGSGFTVSV